MKKNKTIFQIIFLCILLIFCLTGCKSNQETYETKREKIAQELDYLDTKIIDIANKLNNISLENYTLASEEITLEETSGENKGGSSRKRKFYPRWKFKWRRTK